MQRIALPMQAAAASSRIWLFILLIGLISTGLNAQVTDSTRHAGCGTTPDFLASLGIDTSGGGGSYGFTAPDVFPASAKDTCGRFIVYYEDLIVGSGGFADADSGALRRDNLCQVLNYVQTLIDFSQMTGNDYIRLHVDTSLHPGNTAPVGTRFLAQAGPNFITNNPGVINGWVYDYVTSGNDPAPNNAYHAELRVNFDVYYDAFGNAIPTDYLCNAQGSLQLCQLDLYSVLLHEIGHTLGWISLVRYVAGTMNVVGGAATLVPVFSGIFSGLDYSMYVGLMPSTNMQKLITGTLIAPTLNNSLPTPQYNLVWLNDSLGPRNHPVFCGLDVPNAGVWPDTGNYLSYGSHLDDQFYVFHERSRYSPGEIFSPVMGPFVFNGDSRRQFTKEEIKGLENLGDGSMGYSFTNTYTNINTLLTNRRPFTSKLAALDDSLFNDDEYYAEYVAADYTMVNNGGSIIINLWQDTSITDLDGDVVRVFPNSLINYRGCDSNGNNHACLTILNNGTTIRYKPRHNFFGRAQFGFNLYDGNEKGAYICYTIDVTQGSNSSYTAGTDNMILNGNYENGSEVKRVGVEESIPYALGTNMYVGKLNHGVHFNDGHRFGWCSNMVTWGSGLLVDSSYSNCTNLQIAQNSTIEFGSVFANPNLLFWLTTLTSQNEKRLAGYRVNSPSFYDLRVPVQQCKKYRIEYDVYSSTLSNLTLQIGFGDDGTINYPVSQNFGTQVLNFSMNNNTTVTPGTWQHVTREFWYCGDSSNVMFLRNIGGDRFVMDNLSIKEIINPPTLSASISQSNPDTCSVLLTADVTDNSNCVALTYQWQLNGQTITGATSQTYTVPSGSGGTYSVIVNDGCHSDTATAIVYGVCNPYCALGGSATQLGALGFIAGPVTPGSYYITNPNVNIVGSVTMTNAVIYMGPGVTLTIPDQARLTLRHCHLFSCDSLWEGIRMPVGSGTMGVLNILDSTMIEDAKIAVQIPAVSLPFTPPTILNVTNAVFNRNRTNIEITDGASNIGNFFNFENAIFTSRNYLSFPSYPANWPTPLGLKAANYTNDYEAPYAINSTSYLPAACRDGSPAEYGIKVRNVGLLTVANVYELQIGKPPVTGREMNIFDNLRFGIFAESSSFASVNNTFMKLSLGNNGLGTGIFAQPYQVTTTNSRARIYDPGASTYGNYFYGFNRGVEINGYKRVIGHKSYMITNNGNANTGVYGYRVVSRSFDTISLNDNTLYNMKTGIHFVATNSNWSLGQVDVLRNKIGLHPTAGSGQYVNNGIVLEKGGGTAWGPVTGQINCNYDTLTQVHNGITIRNFRTPSLCNFNYVSLKNNFTNNQAGILHEGTQSDWTQSNTVYGFGITSNVATGIRSASGSSHQISCNTVDSLYEGFTFSGGVQSLVQWRGNKMRGNRESFLLKLSSIGSQLASGAKSENAWLTKTGFTYSGNNGQAVVRNTFQTIASYGPMASPLYVENTSIERPNTHSFSSPSVPLNIYALDTGIHLTTRLVYDICVKKMKHPGHVGGVILNIHHFGKFQGTQNFMAQYDLWSALRFADTLIEYDTTGMTDEFMAMGDTSRFGILNKIDSLLMEDDTASVRTLLESEELMTPKYGISATGVIIADNDTANTVVEAYIQYYDLYLKYLGKTLTYEDSLSVTNLANLCVQEYGYAVYLSRTLHNLLYDDMQMFESECDTSEEEESRYQGGNIQQPPSLATAGSNGQQYSLLPNPNSGNFGLRQTLADNAPVQVEVYNAIGAMIFRQDIEFTGKKADISLGDISTGNYLLKLRDKNGNIFTIKFTVLK